MLWTTVCSHSQLLCLERQSARTVSCYALNNSLLAVSCYALNDSLLAQSVAMPWKTVFSHSQLLCLERQSARTVSCYALNNSLLAVSCYALNDSQLAHSVAMPWTTACSQLLCLERQSARTVSCYALNEKVIIPWRTCDENFAAESLGTKSWEHHLKRKFLVKGSSCIMRIPGYCTSFILCTSTMPCTHPSAIPCTYIYICVCVPVSMYVYIYTHTSEIPFCHTQPAFSQQVKYQVKWCIALV